MLKYYKVSNLFHSEDFIALIHNKVINLLGTNPF